MKFEYIFYAIISIFLIYILLKILSIGYQYVEVIRNSVKGRKYKPEDKSKKWAKPEDPLGLELEEEIEVSQDYAYKINEKKQKKRIPFVYNHNYLNGIDKEVIYLDEIKADRSKVVGLAKKPIKGFFTRLIMESNSSFLKNLFNLIQNNPDKGFWELRTMASKDRNKEINKDIER